VNLTEEQILALAPDDSSRKSGKELSNSSKWSNTGVNEKALWGECQGSGKNPYKTQVDLTKIAFKCSCPSRKFPCKHGLGVLLFYVRQKNQFATTESPAWVKEWIEKREEAAEKKTEKADKPVDEEAQAKRQQKRLKKVEDGIGELQLVLKDIVRNGILNMPEKAQSLFGNLTKRMIDSQAQGLAVMTRELAEMNYFRDNWQNNFLEQVVRLHLAATAFNHADTLPVAISEEVKNSIGFTQSTEEVKQQEGIQDEWFVLGKSTEQQEQLFVQRNWLMGRQSGMYALILQFYVRAQLPELNLAPGTTIEGELAFYKSICPYRAIVKSTGKTAFPKQITGFDNWKNALLHEKEKYILSPFITDPPLYINSVTLSHLNNTWYITDKDGNSMPLWTEEKSLFKMLAATGGKKFDVGVLRQEGRYRVLGIFINEHYIVVV
jgi:hypothetical protein